MQRELDQFKEDLETFREQVSQKTIGSGRLVNVQTLDLIRTHCDQFMRDKAPLFIFENFRLGPVFPSDRYGRDGRIMLAFELKIPERIKIKITK